LETAEDVLDDPVEMLSDGHGGRTKGRGGRPSDPLPEQMLGDWNDGDFEGDAEVFLEVICADEGLILLSKPLESALLGAGRYMAARCSYSQLRPPRLQTTTRGCR